MSDTLMLDAALAYAARGWPVFPLAEREKVPQIRKADGGNGLYDATVDVAQITEWWTRWAAGNVGLRTGIAFDVLDLDHPEGWTSLARAVDREGPMTCGPVAMTPSGGAHYLFAVTPGIGNRTKILPGLDWRGKGGYIVGAPSIHPAGGTYEWVSLSDPIPAAPAWLVALLEPSITTFAPGPAPTTRSSGSYGQRALDAELGHLAVAPEGTRNDALNRAAFNLGQLVAGGVLPAAVVAEQLLVVAARIGLHGNEAKNTIASGMRSGMAKPRSVPA